VDPLPPEGAPKGISNSPGTTNSISFDIGRSPDIRRLGNESRYPLGFLLTYARSYFQTKIVTAGKLAREHPQAGLE